MLVIDLKLPESFRERERERRKAGANHMFLYEFVSFTPRYLSKMQNWTLKNNCCLFPPRFLTAMQCHTDSKDWHKVIFDQNSQQWQATWYQTSIIFNYKFKRKYIFKKTDKRYRHQNNQQAILVSCSVGKYT